MELNMTNLNFKLEVFEGPLDLLLHLIGINKINIYDIPIAFITNQYMEYIETMQNMNVDLTSDFIIMAAQLLYIKSRSMLPVEADDAEEEFKAELTERLVEYKKVKEAAQELEKVQYSSLNNYFKYPEKIKKPVIKNADMDTYLLIKAFEEILERKERLKPPPRSTFKGIAERESISMAERIRYVSKMVAAAGRTSFKNIFDDADSRPLKIATFLVILHLVNKGDIVVIEYKNEVFLEKGARNNEQKKYATNY